MNKIDAMLKKEPNILKTQIITTLIVFLALTWSATAMNFSNLSTNGLTVAKNIVIGLMSPDLDFLFDFTSSGVPYLLLETMCIAFLGTLVGAFIAVPLSFLGATNIVPRPVAVLVRTIIMAIRTVPVFIYGIIFVRVVGTGPFSGLLTMSFASIGMLSKMFIETIEDLDTRILESLDAMGCNTFHKIRYGIIPQLMSDFASTIIYRFDMNLRDATVLGLVGAGGIGSPLIFALNAYRWSTVSAILLGLVTLVLIVEFFSTKIRVKLARG